MVYKFTYDLNDADYLEFNKFHFNTASVYRRTTLLFRLLIPTMLLFLAFMSIVNQEDLTEAFINIFFAIVCFFVVKPLFLLSIKVNIKAIKKDGKLPYGKNVRIQFDEEAIYERTEIAESRVKYSNIEKIAEGKSAIYIYFGSMQAFIIPLSTFETKEQKIAFLAFINTKKL